MKRYFPRARRTGYVSLMKLPRLERVAFYIYGGTFTYNAGKSLIHVARHLKDKGIAVTFGVYDRKNFLDITRFYDLPAEEDEERAADHENKSHDNRRAPRKCKVTFAAAVRTLCASNSGQAL